MTWGKKPQEKVVNFLKCGKTFILAIDNIAVDDENLVTAGMHVFIFFKAEKIICHICDKNNDTSWHSNTFQKFMLS